MDNESREIVRLWRVYRTIHQLCNHRGYLISQSELDQDLESFRATFASHGKVDRNALMFMVQKKDDPADQMLVFFPDESSVGIKTIKKYCELMVAKGVGRGIVVYQDKITPSAAKVISEVSHSYHLESFQEADLLVNITEHTLVPQHIVLTPEEKETLLKRYRLKETQLPRIQPSDPIARYYGLARGQVVKIMRPSETSGRYVSYRLCY
ncbi:DNA-directed RNA polymerases II 24 kDa polypeptide (RNA polymerase II subunit 5) [Mortierella sp. GBA30]|nr:DNA-directed RNA polymerases II 24 kDa polypeptide (RNA polymerase II subunit 5) [Mortierella sp. GBA30]